MSVFDGVSCLLISNILGKSKAEFFSKKLKENGGRGLVFTSKTKLSDFTSYTHIIVDASLDYSQLEKILGDLLDTDTPPPVVTSRWLSKCLETQSFVDLEPFLVQSETPPSSPSPTFLEGPSCSRIGQGSSPKKRRKLEQPVEPDSQGSPPQLAERDVEELDVLDIDKSKFICMKPSPSKTDKNPVESFNVNSHIIDTLQEMTGAYKSTKDKWRVFGYQKAIIALKAAREPVDTYEKALALPHVGKSIAQHIAEIAQSGSFEKLERLQASDVLQAVQLFMKIWGVGAETANQWANQGLRSLDDVREKASLTANQKVGLKHFDDFDERMKREEVSRIEKVVEQVVKGLDSRLIMVTCGSYRRGKPTCGDVDILVTHPDGHSHSGVFHKILAKLHEQGFLTDDLTIATHMTGGMMKYLGVCKLPEPQAKYRRIDIIVSPYNQYGCCLVYFTGSAHFNRSMRLMADKMGMSLTEHALYKDVIRGPNNEIIHHGVRVNTPTEESVFKYLGVPYRPPEERDHD